MKSDEIRVRDTGKDRRVLRLEGRRIPIISNLVINKFKQRDYRDYKGVHIL